MLDPEVPDLTFPGMPYGTHETPWDLRVLLYRGGAAMRRDLAIQAIAAGGLKPLLSDRLPLIEAIHAELAAKVAAGMGKGSLNGVVASVVQFIQWGDQSGRSLTIHTAIDDFKAWVEMLIDRVRVKKDLSDYSANKCARNLARVLAPSLGSVAQSSGAGRPGMALMRQTRMRAQGRRKDVPGTHADKQNLEETFAFGSMLADVCNGLNEATVRGPIPVNIHLRDGRVLLLKCELNYADKPPEEMRDKWGAAAAAQARAALVDGDSAIDRRPSLLNQRIEAELHIFIAQTGANLTQAAMLRREGYRWRTEGDDVTAFRVYKGRRGGEVVFRAFKDYRQHLLKYIGWLTAVGLATSDDRLFPLQHKGMIRAAGRLPPLHATRVACKRLGIRYFGPRELRKTRLNWLLRRSRDPDLTAEMSGNAKETLLRVYEQPHHQTSVSEVTRFHLACDSTFQLPGVGRCVDNRRNPEPVIDCPPDAPLPDCVSSEGCLFCRYHRDVLSLDYCWGLASQRHLKGLEMALWRSPKREPIHPANLVIDRINAKLKAIADGSPSQAQWIQDAEDSVRSGNYHPIWSAHIELVETIV